MMKKSIFAVAVASALTLGAAQAETVLYGSIRYDYENVKQNAAELQPALVIKNGEATIDKAGRIGFTHKRLSNLEDAGSRIGIKGSEDLGNNNAVIYQLEWGFDGMDSSSSGFNNRLAILGLTGDWGTFTAGRQDNPFKVTIVDDTVADDFNGSNVKSTGVQRAMTSALAGVGIVNASSHNLWTLDSPVINPENAQGNLNHINGVALDGDVALTIQDATFSRVGKVIAYTTPDFAGFQANAALMMDKGLYGPAVETAKFNGVGNTYSTTYLGVNQQKTIDLWTVNAKYSYDLGNNSQILAKAGYINGKVADNNSSKMYGLFVGYLSDAINVTASYADGSHTPQAGGAAFGFVNFPEAGDVTLVNQNGAKNKYNGWDVGASYSFGPNYFSTVRLAYGQNQIKQNATAGFTQAGKLSYDAGGKDKVKSWAVGFEQKLSTRTRAWVEYGQEETTYGDALIDKKKDNVISVGMRHDF